MNNRPSPLSPTEATIETLQSASSSIRELNCMMRDMIASFHALNEELAADRRARENGKNND